MALVNSLVPDTQLNEVILTSASASHNCQLALGAAFRHLKIPQVITTSIMLGLGEHNELANGFLTYLSFFIKPVKNNVLAWVREKLPGFEVQDFSSHYWADGKMFLALMEACKPGLSPQWKELDSKERETNIGEAFEIAKAQWDLTPGFGAGELEGESFGESKLILFIAGIKHATSGSLVPKMSEQYYKVGEYVTLTLPVKISSETTDTLGVTLEGEANSQPQSLDVKYNPNIKQAYIQIKFESMDCYKVTTKHVPKTSPSMRIPQFKFPVWVIDPSKCYISRALPSTLVVDQECILTVETKLAGPGKLGCFVEPTDSLSVTSDGEADETGEKHLRFKACKVGEISVSLQWGPYRINHGQMSVKIVDPLNEERVQEEANSLTSDHMEAAGMGLKGAFVNKPATFHINAGKPGLLVNKTLAIEIKPLDMTHADTKASILYDATDEDNGTYAITYKVCGEGKYQIGICYKEKHIPHSPYTIQAISGALKCRAFGSMIAESKPMIVGKAVKFFVDSTEAGDGEIAVYVSDQDGRNLEAAVSISKRNEEQTAQHSVQFIPKQVGTYTASVKWDGVPIPESPFQFKASYPGRVRVDGLPYSEDYALVIPKPLSFTIDTSLAGEGKLRAVALLSGSREEPFQLQPLEDGKTLATYTPSQKGEMSLQLTFMGVRALKHAWGCDIVDPKSIALIAPRSYCRTRETQEIVVSGLSNHEIKYLTISVAPSHGDPPLIQNFNPNMDGTATAIFTPVLVGEHLVNAKLAGEPVQNSPIKVLAIAPDACKLDRSIPDVLPIGCEVETQIDTSKAGPGELTFTCNPLDPSTTDCVQVSIRDRCIHFKGVATGKASISLKLAEHDILSEPHKVVVIDPQQCTFNCPMIEKGSVTEGDDVIVHINTSRAYGCTPQARVDGQHQQQIQMNLSEQKQGHYTATFNAMVTGTYILQVSIAGANTKGSPLCFNIEPQKAEVQGKFPSVLRLGQSATVQITASKLDKKPKVSWNIKGGFGVSVQRLKDATRETVKSKQQHRAQAVYDVTITARKIGEHTVHLQVDGCQIKEQPSAIIVFDPSKCRIESKFPKMMQRGVQHSKEIIINTRGAGKVDVTSVSSEPSVLRTEPEQIDKDVYKVTLTPLESSTAPVRVDLEFGGVALPGSPFSVSVCDAEQVLVEPTDLPMTYVNEPFDLTIRTEKAGKGTPQIKASNPRKIKAEIAESKEREYTIACIPLQVGTHSLSLFWNGLEVPNSPITVKCCDPSKCKVEGVPKDGTAFRKGAQHSKKVIVNTKGAGKADVTAISSDPSALCTELEQIDEDVYRVTLTPLESSTAPVRVDLKFGGVALPGSPFSVSVCDADQVLVEPTDLPMTYVNEPFDLTIRTEKAGKGTPEIKVSNPRKIKAEIAESKETEYTIACTPLQVGTHSLSLFWNSLEVPNSPIIVQCCDPSKCKVEGVPIDGTAFPKGAQHSKKVIVKAKEAGKADVTAVSSDPSALCTELEQIDEDVYRVTLTPLESSTAPVRVDLKFGGVALPGSPFSVSVCDADQVLVEPTDLPMTYVNEPFDLTIRTEKAGKGTPEIKVSDPIKIKAGIAQSKEGEYAISCTPLQVGTHSLSVFWNGLEVPNSPIIVQCCDPSKCKMEGVPKDGTAFQKGAQHSKKVIVNAKEAGKADVTAVSSDPSALCTELEQIDEDVYKVTLTPLESSTAPVRVDLKFGGVALPGSPFSVSVCDADQVLVEPTDLPMTYVNEPFDLTIHTEKAGKGTPEIKVSDPVKIKAGIAQSKEGEYAISCTPLQVGTHSLSLFWNGLEVPNSPIIVQCCDPSKCKVEGVPKDGTAFQKGAQHSKNVIVNAKEAGKADVTAVSSDPSALCTELEQIDEDVYKVTLTPLESSTAPVRVDLKFGGVALPGSPFSVSICDAEQVLVEPTDLTYVNEPFDLTIRTEKAGKGTPEIKASNPRKIKAEIAESKETEYTIACTPLQVGTHSLSLFWNGLEVPNSPIAVQCCDPSKCKVEGVPKDGTAFQKGAQHSKKVIVNTKEAGKADVTAVSSDPSALCTELEQIDEDVYKVTLTPLESSTAPMRVDLEFGGVALPGSPFSVSVCDAEQVLVEPTDLPMTYVNELFNVMLRTEKAGKGTPEIKVSDPVKIKAGIAQSKEGEYAIACTPLQVGTHSLSVFWNGLEVPNSPLSVQSCDPSKCKVEGVPKDGSSTTQTTIVVSVDSSKAGEGEARAQVEYSDKSIEELPLRQEAFFTVTLSKNGFTKLKLTFNGREIVNQRFKFIEKSSHKLWWYIIILLFLFIAIIVLYLYTKYSPSEKFI